MRLQRPATPDPYSLLPAVDAFALTSVDIADAAQLDHRLLYTGAEPDAGNVSPQLSWSGFPAETRSFAATCFDPDAPTPSGFWHWVLVDLPASVTSLDAATGSGGVPMPGKAFHVRSD